MIFMCCLNLMWSRSITVVNAALSLSLGGLSLGGYIACS